jgi:DNA-binding transcriptional LysR family regulator
MIALRVSDESQFVTVASPAYLTNRDLPKTPHDLRNHNCIRAKLPDGTFFGWEYKNKGKSVRPTVTGSLTVDEIDLVIRGALDGVGVAFVLYDFVSQYIEEGRLIRLLDAWLPKFSGFYLYHSSRRQVTPPLQALIGFLKVESRKKRQARKLSALA